jgi:hypothetical protein
LKFCTPQHFSQAIEKHEAIMSIILETTTVKETLFSDFKGEIKVGAWGGDFVIFLNPIRQHILAKRFYDRHFTTK